MGSVLRRRRAAAGLLYLKQAVPSAAPQSRATPFPATTTTHTATPHRRRLGTTFFFYLLTSVLGYLSL